MIYFLYLHNSNYQEGNIGRRMNRSINRVKTTLKKNTTGQVSKMEKKIMKKMKQMIKKSTQPLEKATEKLDDKIDNVGRTIKKSVQSAINDVMNAMRNMTNKIINGIKKGVVTPIINVSKTATNIFVQFGLAIADIFTKIAQIPSCMISYITYIFITLRDQFMELLFRPITKRILGKVFPDYVAIGVIRFIDNVIDMVDYVIVYILDFFNLTSIFTNDKCFDLPHTLKQRFSFATDLVKEMKKVFSNFGKIKFS